MSSAPLTQPEIAGRLRNENLVEWLQPWWATQGTAKRSALELMTAILPFLIAEKLSVLDLRLRTRRCRARHSFSLFQSTRGLCRSRLVPIEPLRGTEHAGRD